MAWGGLMLGLLAPAAPSVAIGDRPSGAGSQTELGTSPEAADAAGFEDEWGTPPADPLEGFNRKMLDLNLWLDDYILSPIATGYAFLVPRPVRTGLERAYTNIKVPQRFANSLLQGKFVGAGRELARFTLNSTVGVGGLLDPAARLGLEPSSEDFGQTLGVWGVPPGAYLMVPWFGPFTVRDASGAVVDVFLDPVFYLVGGTLILAVRAGQVVGERVNQRSLDPEMFENLDRFSLDPYVAVQDFYLQHRENAVRE